MAPNVKENIDLLFEEKSYEKLPSRKYQIVWYTVVYYIYLHIGAIYGFYLGVTQALWPTIAFTTVMHVTSALGITAGAHRLWTHKTYKAKLPLETVLMIFQSATNTHSIITWIRDHILHHKYTDTDADPHTARRGFFYCHIGWLMVRKHPEAQAKGKLVDLSEFYANPVLRFQQKHSFLVITSAAFIVPTLTPLLWNEDFKVAFFINLFRAALVLNSSLVVNSFAHMWGTRPYDKRILPTQNKLASFIAFGEGFHNYHHVFPQDYRTSEVGDMYLNFTTRFIDFCALIGQAYDLRSVTDDVIAARMKKTGEKL